MRAFVRLGRPMCFALRLIAIAGFALTFVGAGFVAIYASLVEGSYEAAVRSEPWEWVLVASLVGGVAAAVGAGGLARCRRGAIQFSAIAQGIAVVVVLVLAVPNLESSRSDFERNFISAASLVLAFDVAVVVASWMLRRRTSAA